MNDKPPEYWAALLGMAIYTATKKAETAPIAHRIAKTMASALLTFALSPWVATRLGIGEVASAVVIMAIGLTVLDVATAIVSDETFIKDLVRSWAGRGQK